MSATGQLSDADRLDALVRGALAKAEADAVAGKPPTVATLNGLRRLLQRRDQDRELERINALTRDRPRD